MVQQITSNAEFTTLTSSDKLTVVDFFAEWCGPCKVIAPYVHELSTKFTNVQFIKVDVDQLEDLAQECGISAMPTFQFYKGGKKVAEFRGADKNKLLQTVEQHQ